MPQGKQPRKMKKSVKRNPSSSKVPTSAIVYRGSLQPAPQDNITVTMYESASVSTDGSGTYSAQFGNNPSSARNWTEYSTAWAEYRVLGVRFKYNNNSTCNTSTLLGINGYHGIVHGFPTVPTTLVQMVSTGVTRPWNAFKAFVREWRMSSAEEAEFITVASPAATTDTLVMLGLNGTISTLYGTLQIEYLVQFRTHTL
jgi:hypothetical protein